MGCGLGWKLYFYGSSLKNPVFRSGRVHEKPIYREELLKKGWRLEQFADLRGNLGEKEGGGVPAAQISFGADKILKTYRD